MDSVRFGRALGTGARLAAQTAAKTLVTAVDAAAAPNPSTAPSPRRSPATTAHRAGQTTARTATRTATNVRESSRGIARGSRNFRQATWGPFAKLSGVLWLEFTGVFFGLFALSAGIAAWKLRGDLHRTPANAEGNTHLLLALAVAAVFGYFCASSFLRANRRGRRP